MEYTLILLGLLAVFGTSSGRSYENQLRWDIAEYEARLFENQINKTINAIFGHIRRLDPIHVDYDKRKVALHAYEITNFHLGGFGDIYAKKLYLNGLLEWNLIVTMRAPEVSYLTESYKVDGPLFFGDGSVRVVITNIEEHMNLNFSVVGDSKAKLEFKHSIGNADVSITGLYNDEKLSADVTAFVKNAITGNFHSWQEFLDDLTDITKQIIRKIVN